jgi:transposase
MVARKTYSDEFRRDAVELYRSTPGTTVVGIAGDLGIMDTTMSAWLKAAGVPVRSRHAGSGDKAPPELAHGVVMISLTGR